MLKKREIEWGYMVMAKCDICGGTTIRTEQIGDLCVCKGCIMKEHGFMFANKIVWDAEEDTGSEKNFFLADSMLTCDCCGKPVQVCQAIGDADMCGRCYGELNAPKWISYKYDDNEQTEAHRAIILKMAKNRRMPAAVVDGINKHFDNKLQKDLICVLDGGMGQKLKVFKDYCVLLTQDSFDMENTSMQYAKVLKDKQKAEEKLSNDTAKLFAKRVISGGIVKAGISLATSAAISAAADKYVPDKKRIKVVKGAFKVDYRKYFYAEHQPIGDSEIGFIQFVSRRTNEKYSDDVLFFYNSNSEKITEAHKLICEGIDSVYQAATQVTSTSVADEIMKFKQLLDMGAITQEEYDLKKSQLLK